MRPLVLVLVVAIACSGRAVAPRPVDPFGHEHGSYVAGRAEVSAALGARIEAQQRAVEAMFRAPLRPFQLEVLDSHAALEAFVRHELPCFAVATATGSRFVMLHPDKWKTEACDHDGDDDEDVDKVILHELVHVAHGQHRPDDPELDEAEAIGWFVEGLATYLADQLDVRRFGQLQEVVAARAMPRRLDDVWTGKARYALAGSLVAYIDRRWGRPAVLRMLPAISNAQILSILGIGEETLLGDWARSVSGVAPGG